MVTQAELDALGIVAPPAKTVSASVRSAPTAQVREVGPAISAAWIMRRRPAAADRPDISRADFTFCLLAMDWGWSVEETADRLMLESGKAHKNGKAYADRTVRNAAAGMERRGGVVGHSPGRALPTRPVNGKEAERPDEHPTEPKPPMEPAGEAQPPAVPAVPPLTSTPTRSTASQ